MPRLKDTHKTVQFDLQIRRYEPVTEPLRANPTCVDVDLDLDSAAAAAAAALE